MAQPDQARSAAPVRYVPAYTEQELDAAIGALDKLFAQEQPPVARIAEVVLIAASGARPNV